MKKPGRRRSGEYWQRPPGDPVQKSVRMTTELIERVEARAYEESTRLGVTVTFADLTRRGLERVLLDALPPEPVRMPCIIAQHVSGAKLCVECQSMFHGGGSPKCPRNGEAVNLG